MNKLLTKIHKRYDRNFQELLNAWRTDPGGSEHLRLIAIENAIEHECILTQKRLGVYIPDPNPKERLGYKNYVQKGKF